MFHAHLSPKSKLIQSKNNFSPMTVLVKDKLMTAETTMELMLGLLQSQKPLIWLDYYKLNHTWRLYVFHCLEAVGMSCGNKRCLYDDWGFDPPPTYSAGAPGWTQLPSTSVRQHFSHMNHMAALNYILVEKLLGCFWLTWIMFGIYWNRNKKGKKWIQF